MKTNILGSDFYQNIKKILNNAYAKSYKAINSFMVEAYWSIGRMIVEEEQKGKKKSNYGEYLIKKLSEKMTIDFGKGFSISNLKNFRQFYLTFQKSYTLCSQLSWSHSRLIMRIKKQEIRDYYINECIEQNWSVRVLERQINSLYYERILSSKNQKIFLEKTKENVKENDIKPQDFIKDPYILEFLSIKENTKYLETEFEQALIEKLKSFLLEMGKGFSFVSRQKRISTETSHFYIDLVFYNYVLKCFFIVDLKIGKLTHQDIGQMDMYVRLFEDKHKGKDDNPTVGLLLCTEKDETVVKYSVLNDCKNIFASKYKLYLPSEDELRLELEKEKKTLNHK